MEKRGPSALDYLIDFGLSTAPNRLFTLLRATSLYFCGNFLNILHFELDDGDFDTGFSWRSILKACDLCSNKKTRVSLRSAV